jgi:hypothetical protein
MTREDYDQYLLSFNGKDYSKVLQYWAPEFEVIVQGQLLFNSPETLIKTYGFLHDRVKEEVFVQSFLSDKDKIFMEAIVRITAKQTITAEDLAREGINGIMPINEGDVVDIPQFIHYHLEHGKFKKGVCLVNF